MFDRALRSEMEKKLKKKGYTYQAKGGDLTFDYRITVFEKAAADMLSHESQAIWRRNSVGDLSFDGWTEIDGAGALNTNAVLLLTAYRGESKEKVWEAYVRRIVKNEGSIHTPLIEKAVESAVGRLLGSFPAK